MIPYMVGNLAPNLSHLTRGLVKYVPGRCYFSAVPSQNGDTYVTSPPPPPIVELVDTTIVNPCSGSYLRNAARHTGKHHADAVERKKNEYRGSFPATYSLLPVTMSTCDELGPEVHASSKSSSLDG